MKKSIKVAVCLICVLAGCMVCALLSASTANSNKDEDINQSIAETLTVMNSVQVGAYQSPDGRIDSLTEAEIQETINAFNQHMDRYYASECGMRTTYKELNESYLRNPQNTIDYNVLSDMENLQINSLKIDKDGNQAAVQYTAMVWTVWVVEDPDKIGETGTFRVQAAVNEKNAESIFVKEDNEWKLLDNKDLTLNMFPEPSEEADSENRSKEILETTYTSFEEALAAAQEIRFEELDHNFS